MHIWAPPDVMLKTRHSMPLSFQRVIVWLVRYIHQEDQLSLVYFQMYIKILPPPCLLHFYSLHGYFTRFPFFLFSFPVALVLVFCFLLLPVFMHLYPVLFLKFINPSSQPVVPGSPQLSALSLHCSSSFSPTFSRCWPNPPAENRKSEYHRHLSKRKLCHRSWGRWLR